MNKAGNSKNSRTKHYIKFNLYKEYYIDDPYFNGKYKKLAEFIQRNDLDSAITESNKIKLSQKNINEALKENRYKRFLKKFKNRI